MLLDHIEDKIAVIAINNKNPIHSFVTEAKQKIISNASIPLILIEYMSPLINSVSSTIVFAFLANIKAKYYQGGGRTRHF